MTTAYEIELLVSRLGVLLWQLEPSASADAYEHWITQYLPLLTTPIGETLNVTAALSRPAQAHRSPTHFADNVCPFI